MKQFFADFAEAFACFGKMTIAVLGLCVLVFGCLYMAIGIFNLALHISGGNVWVGAPIMLLEMAIVVSLFYALNNYIMIKWSERCRRK